MAITRLSDDALKTLKLEHSWLDPTQLNNAYVVGNTDLDGLLCLPLINLLAPNAKFAGFYTGEQLLLTSEGNAYAKQHGLGALRAIECDYYAMPSVGQHYTLANSVHPHLNPNVLRGLAGGSIRNKYPLNTLFFLWRWFGLDIPSDSRRRDFLGFLLYPDGVLLKVVRQYYDNVREWLDWLDIGVNITALIGDDEDARWRQLSRCLFKEFGTTQIGLTFTPDATQPDTYRIDRRDSMLNWLYYFADRLGLPRIGIDDSYVLHKRHYQHRAMKIHATSLLDATKLHLNGLDVVSDAWITSSEWSVTLPRPDDVVSLKRGVAAGLSAEPPKWVQALELGKECEFRTRGCSRAECIRAGVPFL